MITLLSVFGVFGLSAVLIKSAEIVVSSIRRIARETQIPGVVVSAVVISVATSLPELFVGLASSLSGTSSLSLGNVVGANISNLSLVLGLAGLLAGTIYIHETGFLKKEWLFSFGLGIAPMLLLYDRGLSRIDGIILLCLYGVYVSLLFRRKVGEVEKGDAEWSRVLRNIKEHRGPFGHSLARFFGGLAVLLLAAEGLVRLSTGVAESMGVPLFLVGLLVVSVGTTLPEIAFSYRSIKDGAPGLIIGNLLGTLAFNSTFVLGIVALISPIEVSARRSYIFAVGAYILAGLLFWIFVRSKRRLERWEAFLLLALYLTFFAVQMYFDY